MKKDRLTDKKSYTTLFRIFGIFMDRLTDKKS